MSIKVSRTKETVLIKHYMKSDWYDEHTGNPFEYAGMEFYLVKNGSLWCVTEKYTRKFVITWRKTRKQALQEAKQFIDNNADKMLELVRATL